MPIITGPRLLSPTEARVSDSTQQAVLGSRVETLDGRIFRYARAGSGGALVAGNLQQAPAINSKSIDMAVQAAVAANATVVDVTLASSTASANEFADGFLVINDVDGEGIAYRVGGHPASVTTDLDNVQLTEPIQVALTTSSQVSLINTFRGVIQCVATTPTGSVVGGADKAYAASDYFWLHTGGPGSVLNADSAAVGAALMQGTTAGAVIAQTAGLPIVGKNLQAHSSGDHRGIFWLLN